MITGKNLFAYYVRASLCTDTIYEWEKLSDEMRRRWDLMATNMGGIATPAENKATRFTPVLRTVGETEVMRAVFTLCEHPTDWKNPIDVIVEERYATLCVTAIGFTTAQLPEDERLPDGKVRLRCTGYRMGPAGP